MPRIEFKARLEAHGLTMSRVAAGMLEQKANILGLQRLVVDLQLIEQPAQVRAAHNATCRHPRGSRSAARCRARQASV